jgi:hypothetical protein
VPTRRRYDGWTPERQRRYVAALACWGNGNIAAARVGLTPQSAARLRRRPDAAEFTRACEQAIGIGKNLRRARAKRSNFIGPGGLHLSHPMNLPSRRQGLRPFEDGS